MYPAGMRSGDADDLRNRIDATGTRGTNTGNDGDRSKALCNIGPDRGVERVGPHTELLVGGNLDEVVVAESECDDRFVDGGVRVLGAVHAQHWQIGTRGHAACTNVETRRFARRCQRIERAHRCRVGDLARPSVAEPHHLPQPVKRNLLELGDGGTRRP